MNVGHYSSFFDILTSMVVIKGGRAGASTVSLKTSGFPDEEYHPLYIKIENDDRRFEHVASPAWIGSADFERFENELRAIRDSRSGSALLATLDETEPFDHTSIRVGVENWEPNGSLLVTYEVVTQHVWRGKTLKNGLLGYFFIDGEYVNQYIELREEE